MGTRVRVVARPGFLASDEMCDAFVGLELPVLQEHETDILDPVGIDRLSDEEKRYLGCYEFRREDVLSELRFWNREAAAAFWEKWLGPTVEFKKSVCLVI